jgi:plastocyanin
MRRVLMVLVLMVGALTSCGGDGETGSGSGSGEERSVLVDFRHDEFAGAFLQYYPEHLSVRPGDTVQFRQAWTGEPHSVTFGTFVDDFSELFERFQEYESPEDAVAGGESQADLDRFLQSYTKLSAMADAFVTVPAGAEPCFVEDAAKAPVIRDIETDAVDRRAVCPDEGRKQPRFNGRQALYNSGFIPYSGDRGNNFTMPIAEDATPGTYRYFCNYHFIFMSGDIEVVESGAAIPSQSEVSRQARKELEADAARALERVRDANSRKVGDTIRDVSGGPEGETVNEVTLPLSGRGTDDETPVIINEFFPRKLTAKVNEKVTWSIDGSLHTVSFNVPKYFPIFTVADGGRVEWDPQAWEPVGWDLDFEPRGFSPENIEPLTLDAGRWDGRGGFHSSGALLPGDTFSVSFTRAGTYPFACVLHPQMVGTLVVTA